ncbi:hypothetical protein Afil01_36150 [Actinorhabdospora filicis]|uniref:Histidine phosphatase family protein n=1 Tax=Actinorhabdospora filicis TaxID=1785913 RepID=A0A9W6SMQ3_9ACTN|nr:histidine phosphatase family protein [Actinorhabdospora filicis]GLZ78808.1 hypothetical protein Afil01_36150 [Actinorhabdospora filicis]
MPITLVRHAMPVVDPSVPAHTWGLSEQGRHAAAGLRLPPGPCHHTASAEPKAAQTIHATRPHATVHIDPAFGEILRPHDPTLTGEQHRAQAAAYLSGTDHPGWETRAQAITRFDDAVHRHATHPGHLIIATHGMVMTLWLTTVLDLPDPVAYWRALAFPDTVTLQTPHRRPAAS